MHDSLVDFISLDQISRLLDALDFEDDVFVDFVSVFVIFKEVSGDLVLHLAERSVNLRELISNGFFVSIIDFFKLDGSTKSGQLDIDPFLWIDLCSIES